MVYILIDLHIYNVVLTKTSTLQYMYIFRYKYICFVFLDKISLKFSCGYVYCLIFGSVLVRVVDYLELVSELLFLHARCAIFLLYHGVKLYKSYISMIRHCHPIYSRPTLLGGFYITNSHNSPPVDMTLITRANKFEERNFTTKQMLLIYQL